MPEAVCAWMGPSAALRIGGLCSQRVCSQCTALPPDSAPQLPGRRSMPTLVPPAAQGAIRFAAWSVEAGSGCVVDVVRVPPGPFARGFAADSPPSSGSQRVRLHELPSWRCIPQHPLRPSPRWAALLAPP